MNIRQARNLLGLTQSQIFDVPVRTIQNWEGGQRECPAYVERLVIQEMFEIERRKRELTTDHKLTWAVADTPIGLDGDWDIEYFETVLKAIEEAEYKYNHKTARELKKNKISLILIPYEIEDGKMTQADDSDWELEYEINEK